MQAAAAAAPGLLRQTRVALRLRHIAPAPVVGLFYLFCLCAGVGARRAIGRHCEYRQSPSVGAHAQQRSLFFCVAARRAELQHVRRAGVLQTACDRAQPRRIDGLRVAAVPARPCNTPCCKTAPQVAATLDVATQRPDCTRTNISAHAPHTRMDKQCKAHCTHAHARECHRTRAHARARNTVHSTARSHPLYHSAGARLVRTRRGAVHALCRSSAVPCDSPAGTHPNSKTFSSLSLARRLGRSAPIRKPAFSP